MRTTVSISDPLLERAKLRAKELGVSLGTLLDKALVLYLVRPTEVVDVELPVSPGGQALPGIDLTSNRSLYEVLDGAEGLRA